MSLGRARSLCEHLAVGAGFLSMTSAGDFPIWAIAGFLALLAVSLLKGSRRPARLGPLFTLATAGALLALLFLVAAGTLDIVIAACAFAAVLSLGRVLSRKGASDDGSIFLTALLMMAGGAALSGELTFAVCFALYGVTATLGLTFSHLERAADEAKALEAERRSLASRGLVGALGGLSLASLAVAAAFFALFPRVDARWLDRHPGAGRNPLIGFSDHVSLGGYGALRNDPRPALRVRLPGLPARERLDLLWRGRAFETFDGQSWSASPQRARPLPQAPPGPSVAHAEIEVLPVAGASAIFSGGEVVAARIRDLDSPAESALPHRAWLEANGDAVVEPRPRGFYAFDVWWIPPDPARLRGLGTSYPRSVRERALQLPAGLDPRVRALARRWAGDRTDPWEIALAIRDRLRTDYRYSTVLLEPSRDPVADFLFARKEGHCALFSTAMALLLRTLGVPAREVTGFSGGVLAPAGDHYLVRAGDAHSWVEVYFPGIGYAPFDPTPPSFRDQAPGGLEAVLAALGDELSSRWRNAVLDYDLATQVRMAGELARALSRAGDRFARGPEGRAGVPRAAWRALALAALLALAFLGQRRLRRRKQRGRRGPSEASSLYLALLRKLGRRGLARLEFETPGELAQRLGGMGRPEAGVVGEVTALYYRARFGGAPWTPAERQRVAELIKRL